MDLTELSLFTGCGGGVYGGLLMGWRSIGYVEKDEHCQRVIAQRIKDGIFHDAPIFDYIRAFISDGYAASYQGMVDVLTAGFPCQPFSCAGKQAGADDERNMWPETAECIRIVRPRSVLLENVPGLIALGYLGTILGDLAACGYDARWDCIPAKAVGANHQRDRLWIVAHAQGEQVDVSRQPRIGGGIREDAADADSKRRDTEGLHLRRRRQNKATACTDRSGTSDGTEQSTYADRERLQGRGKQQPKRRQAQSKIRRVSWWQDQRGIPLLDDGAAYRRNVYKSYVCDRICGLGKNKCHSRKEKSWSHRIKASGNSQVPVCAATAFLSLSRW